MNQRPTVRQLEYFVAVGRTLNFRQAAESCFVSQPALSTQLQQLEELLGLSLFERDKRQVLPTAAGRQLLERAQSILQDVDRLGEDAQALLEPLSGELRLGVIPTVAPYLLPKVLGAVREKYPKLRLLLREDQTARIVEQLVRGDLDLLLLALDVDLAGQEEHFLFNDPFHLATPPDHPLSAKEMVSVEDLDDQRTLLLEEGHCLREHAMTLCRRGNMRELVDFRATSLGTLLQMVTSGLGVTLIPEMAVPENGGSADASDPGAGGGLKTIPFAVDGPGRRIGLVWRNSSPRAAEFTAFGETVTQAYMQA